MLFSPTVDELDAWLAAPVEPEPVVVETSGSTGKPKRVVLSRRAVLASGAATTARLGGAGPWVLALPMTYVAGLQVVCRSLAAGHRPVLLDDHASLAGAVEAAGGAPYVSLVATQLVRALGSPADTAALAACPAVLVGGGPVDRALRERAREAGIRVGGDVRLGRDRRRLRLRRAAAGRRRRGDRGRRTDPDRRADPVRRVRRRPGADGRRAGGRLVPDGGRAVGSTRTAGSRCSAGSTTWSISGGVKVPTGIVAARLREHPAVTAVDVGRLPDDEWGERVVAWVVGDLSLEEARDWVAERAPPVVGAARAAAPGRDADAPQRQGRPATAAG